MEKSTIYLITLAIIFLTILGVTGEYFTYRYYALLADRQASNQQQASSTAPKTDTNQQASGSSENSITSFNFNSPKAVGTIYQSNHTVAITVPPITDISKLTPTIEVSQNAAISPASGVQQDFTTPVTYTVTAQNGATQTYTVTVNVASILKSIEKKITSFKLSGFNPEVDGYINNNTYTVTAIVPDGTDLTNLTPIIQVSDGATISPQSGVVQDFTNPVIYTVTDSYGSTQNYTITVITESNSG